MKVAIYSPLPSWDPAQAGTAIPLEMERAVYDTLLGVDAKGNAIPWLATRWEYTDQAKTDLRLELREDVKFDDGTPFNSEVVVANLNRFKSANGPQAAQLRSVASVTAVDKKTVDIKLSAADPLLTYNLSQAAGLQANPKSAAAGTLGTTPSGTGAYKLSPKSVEGTEYVYEARDGYWNPEVQHWKTMTLRLLSDPAAGFNALASKQVDMAQIDPRQSKEAQARKLEVTQWTSAVQGLLLLDRAGTKVPALGDVRVRQAINYAFDRKLVVQQNSQGDGEPTSQIFAPDSSAYVPELDNAYPYDLDKAKKLMADAGYADGFTIKMPWAPGNDVVQAFAKQSLEAINIKVETVSIPRQNFQASISGGDYVAPWSIIGLGPTWQVVQRTLLPQSQYNAFKSTTPDVQKLLDAIQQSGDSPEAAQKLSRYMVENAWFAPWYRLATPYAADGSKVKVLAQAYQNNPSIFGIVPAG
ncbi:ABC transporter substrate-binding protein [Paenarthrobacter sp. YIM B13468]|uniref:ABC transporter substrate-binding protein n=1 Tax=Paenarthrobacter sp. YIM B13468 TaxID=3366295 RepID=UPI00366E6F76